MKDFILIPVPIAFPPENATRPRAAPGNDGQQDKNLKPEHDREIHYMSTEMPATKLDRNC